ncbi:MAG: hypothetical protein KGL39_24295 [Patescibacteria group bacterium]|nr:hypothetical protein [Patescibacteria group bacterium]
MIYRNKTILKAAKNAPQCFLCGNPNDGTVVMAHSNQGRDGHGMGVKAHDYRVAALCFRCHTFIDSSPASRETKIERWEQAHRKTLGWLIESKILHT